MADAADLKSATLIGVWVRPPLPAPILLPIRLQSLGIFWMYAYIDESGDPGTNRKGSRWLVFGCVMVAESVLQELQSDVQDVRNRVSPQGGKHLHFRDLPHDDKVGALNLMADMQWTGVVVASDTTSPSIHDPQLLYDVTAIHAVEKALAYAKELNEFANIYFERSRVLKIDQLRSLARLMVTARNLSLVPGITPSYQLEELRKGDAHGLDIADGLAHAAFRALEPNQKWGHFEPAYLNILKPRLWRGPANANSEGWGLTLVPTELAGKFREEYSWLP